MSTREERARQLTGDTSTARADRGRSFLDSGRSFSKTDEEKTSWLEEMLERRNKRVMSTPPVRTETKRPSFEETRDSFAEAGAKRAGTFKEPAPVTFSVPKPDRSVGQFILSASPKEKEEAKRDLVTSFFFGTGSDKPLGQEDQGLYDYTQDNGVVGFLYGNILKSSEQRQAERYEKLVNSGVDPDRAYQISVNWAKDGAMPTDLSDSEASAMKWYTVGQNAFIALELADLLFVGKPINMTLKSMTRGAQHRLFVDIAESGNSAAARSIIATRYPELVGTEGLEDLIKLGVQASKDDGWRKVLADTKTGKKILEGQTGKKPTTPSTETQRIFYENNIPVLRGGAASDNVADLMSVRKEVTQVVRGEREGQRLSADAILNDEIQAGSLPFKTTAEDTIDVFTTRDIKSAQLGERVALTEGVARASLQGGADVKKLSVKADDLVRLDDGTFVYAPKKSVTEEFTPQIEAVREQARERVLKKEKMEADLARDIRIAERQEQDMIRREARAKAETVLRKEAEKLNIAKDVVKNGDRRAAEVIEQTNKKATELAEAAVARKNKAAKAIADKQAEIKKLVEKVGRLEKKRPGIIAKTKKRIAELKAQKNFTKVNFGEEMPPKLQELELDVKRLKELIDNHPAAWMKQYVKRNGQLKGEVTDLLEDSGGRSMDGMVSQNSDGRYNSIKEAHDGYKEYQNYQTKLKAVEETFKEQESAWKASAKDRGALDKEAYRTERIQEARDQGQDALKQNIKTKTGMEKQVRTLRNEVAGIKKDTPELGKTKTQLEKPFKTVAKMRNSGVKANLARMKKEANQVLKDAGEAAEKPKAAPKKKRTPPPVRKESVEYTSAKSDVTKEYSKAGMMDEPVGEAETGLKPLSGTDKQVVSQVNQRIQDEVSMVNELLEKAGVTTETLGVDPSYHRYAKNSVQREKAIQKIYSNPEGTYREFISGKIDGDSALAFIGENLLDHPFVRNDNVRRLAVSKAMKESATGAAQQLQGYSAISKRSYSGIMKQLDDSMIEGMKKNGVDLEKEKNALRAEFDKIVSNYPTADPSDIIKEITRLTCQS